MVLAGGLVPAGTTLVTPVLEYFQICFYFHGHQKEVHLWQRGAIQGGATEVWEAIAPNCLPLDLPLIISNFMIYQDRLETNLLQLFAHT